MKANFATKKVPGKGWTVVDQIGNRAERKSGAGSESAPLTSLHLTLAQAQATADSMNRDRSRQRNPKFGSPAWRKKYLGAKIRARNPKVVGVAYGDTSAAMNRKRALKRSKKDFNKEIVREAAIIKAYLSKHGPVKRKTNPRAQYMLAIKQKDGSRLYYTGGKFSSARAKGVLFSSKDACQISLRLMLKQFPSLRGQTFLAVPA